MGGEDCIFSSPPSEKNPMALLVVWTSSTCGKTHKYKYAIANRIPIITFDQLVEALDGEEEEDEDEDESEEEEED
jgi:hypothetical protein